MKKPKIRLDDTVRACAFFALVIVCVLVVVGLSYMLGVGNRGERAATRRSGETFRGS